VGLLGLGRSWMYVFWALPRNQKGVLRLIVSEPLFLIVDPVD